MNYEVRSKGPLCVEVRMERGPDFEQWFLLTSDIHFDNPKCKRDLYFKHLRQAKERGAGVFCFGDFFCLMQGKYDPRRNKSAIRPEHNGHNYLDLVISDTMDKLSPYHENFILLSEGNHETAITKNLETDMLQRYVDLTNHTHSTAIIKGQYWGFVELVVSYPGKHSSRKITMFYHHGKWGGVVSKGVQGIARYSSFVPDADILVSGHTHDKWAVPDAQLKLNRSGEVTLKEVMHVKTATYKEEFLDGTGWAVEKIVKPKPLGGYWLRLFIDEGELKFETIRAQ